MHTQGLVHGIALDGHGGGRELDAAEALQAAAPEQGLLWLHFDYTSEQAQAWIREHSGLREGSAEALLALETRPRVSSSEEGLLVYLRGVNLNPGAEPEDMIAIRLFVQRGRIISTQRRPLASIRDIRRALQQGEGACSGGELVAELVDRLTWYMEDVVGRIEADLDALDDIPEHGRHQRRASIADTRRRIVVLRRYLAPQRDALARLQADPSPLLADNDRFLVREAGERLQRLLEDLDMFRDHATLAQEELQSQLSDQLNRRMYVLAVITGLFLPLGFLTGLFGVNLGGIPGADSAHAFAWFVGTLTSVLVVVVMLNRLRFRSGS